MNNPIARMKALKMKIDQIETRLILETMDDETRKTLVNDLDHLWDRYESQLRSTWEEIDPSIFEDE